MKKKIFFFIYCVLMIGGLVLFLIFSPQLSKSEELKNKNSEVEQPQEPETNPPDNSNTEDKEDEEEKEEIFATKIKLNCDDDIIISVGSSVELISGFISVEPSKYLNDVTTSVSVESGAINGISFSNNVITANDIGKYTIRFSVHKTSSILINDSLNVRVVEKEVDNKVKLISNNFTSETTYSLNEILEINEMYTNYTIQNNEYFTYLNNQITFTKEGNSNLLLNLNLNYMILKYSFSFLVNPKISSAIIIEGENNGVLELAKEVGEFFEIAYNVKYGSGENIAEIVEINLDNNNVLEFIEVSYSIITFRVISKSSVKLTLTLTKVDVPPKVLIIIIK